MAFYNTFDLKELWEVQPGQFGVECPIYIYIPGALSEIQWCREREQKANRLPHRTRRETLKIRAPSIAHVGVFRCDDGFRCNVATKNFNREGIQI